MFANANFRGKNEVAFTADDFLGTGDRAQRQREDAISQQRAMMANAALAKIKKDAPPTDDIPAWAVGEYQGKVANG